MTATPPPVRASDISSLILPPGITITITSGARGRRAPHVGVRGRLGFTDDSRLATRSPDA
ncbi:MAG: hypothetical protein J07HR59_00483, partial [Halorubrum sp. J07HR59]